MLFDYHMSRQDGCFCLTSGKFPDVIKLPDIGFYTTYGAFHSVYRSSLLFNRLLTACICLERLPEGYIDWIEFLISMLDDDIVRSILDQAEIW
jgi:hypothetical protein